MFIKSLFSAFLMYSAIPMPKVVWKEENRRYALCFFPVVGMVIGAVEGGWFYWGEKGHLSCFMVSVLATAIPFFITGGIHMDGYMDVQDAKACMGDRDKKMSVMKDPRVGAFAVMYGGLYLLLETGCYYELYRRDGIWPAAGIFVLSRALSGLAAVTFPSAVKSGSLKNFVQPSHKRVTILAECFMIILASGFMMWLSLWQGAAALLAALLTFLNFYRFSQKEFGGITGDLAGYFLQNCELAQLAAMVIVTVIR